MTLLGENANLKKSCQNGILEYKSCQKLSKSELQCDNIGNVIRDCRQKATIKHRDWHRVEMSTKDSVNNKNAEIPDNGKGERYEKKEKSAGGTDSG